MAKPLAPEAGGASCAGRNCPLDPRDLRRAAGCGLRRRPDRPVPGERGRHGAIAGLPAPCRSGPARGPAVRPGRPACHRGHGERRCGDHPRCPSWPGRSARRLRLSWMAVPTGLPDAGRRAEPGLIVPAAGPPDHRRSLATRGVPFVARHCGRPDRRHRTRATRPRLRAARANGAGMRFRRRRGGRDSGSPTARFAPGPSLPRPGAPKIKDLRPKNADSRGLCCSSRDPVGRDQQDPAAGL